MTYATALHLLAEADAAERVALDAEAHIGKFIIAYLDLKGAMPTHGYILRRRIEDARTKRDIARRAMRRANDAVAEVVA